MLKAKAGLGRLLPVRGGTILRHTNVAFGGPDRKTLFITEGETGSVLSAVLDAPGKLLFSHR